MRKVIFSVVMCNFFLSFSIQSEKGWCVTGNSTTPDEGPVLLLMDDAVIEVEAVSLDDPISKGFAFLPDPQVISIHPQVTTLR